MSVQISVRVSKEQKEKLVDLAKNENKTITQYIVDRCIVEDSYTDASNVDNASNRIETVLQEQIEQIRADFETERSFYVSQIEQKDKQIAEMLGVAQAQYARWENGGRNPRDDTVEKLAEILNTSFEILKGRDDGLEEIVSLLREHELTEEDKNQIISLLQDFLINKSK